MWMNNTSDGWIKKRFQKIFIQVVRMTIYYVNSKLKSLHLTCTASAYCFNSCISLLLIKQNSSCHTSQSLLALYITIPVVGQWSLCCHSNCSNLANSYHGFLTLMASWTLAGNLLTFDLPCSVCDKDKKTKQWVYVFSTDYSMYAGICPLDVFVCLAVCV